MVFRRFFDRGAKGEGAPEQAAVSETEAVDESAVTEETEAPDVDAEQDDVDLLTRARAVLPMGTSTGSKRVEALYGSAQSTGPTHFSQAVGCRVVDVDGNEYVDCTMALGAVALGYAEPNVSRAVADAIANGNVCGLADAREVDVAERLCGIIPCADKVQFLKSGAEAMAAAVRIARTYTGRDLVVGSGYFGWLDWCSDEAAGVPQKTRDDFRRVPFDDVTALARAVSDAGDRLAAIVIEPVVERLPSTDWIQQARDLAKKKNAVLIFDEMKTGFRLKTGGYQAFADVVPDLAAFGKAMANGFPLAAVVGDRDLMDASRRTWISSTLGGESAALAAAGAVLAWHDAGDVCGSLWTIGAELRRVIGRAIEASGVDGITVDGIDPMWFLRFDSPAREQRFLELAASHGVLFKRGAYNYAAMAHDEETITEIEAAASAALVELLEEENGRA